MFSKYFLLFIKHGLQVVGVVKISTNKLFSQQIMKAMLKTREMENLRSFYREISPISE